MAQEDKVDRGDDFVPTDEKVAEKAAETVVDPADLPPVIGEKPQEGEKKTEETPEKEQKVPLSRLNEAVLKEREKTASVVARARELEEQLAAQVTSQDIVEAQKIVKEMIKQRNSHLGDGELDKATEIDGKIFELQEAIAERKAEIKAETSKSQAVETMKYDAVVERLENEHPELNPDNEEEYDDDLATEIRALMRGYQTELRLSPAQALNRAAKRVFGTMKAPDKGDEVGVRRKAEATERNLDAQKKQPASTKDVGLDHDKKGGGLDAKTVLTMKYEEFSKLGDDVLSRLRGDTL